MFCEAKIVEGDMTIHYDDPKFVPSEGKVSEPISKPRLINQVREVIRCKHYSIRTEQTYVDWIRRYIYYHNKQHPKHLSEQHINAFLTHLAVNRKVAASTQNQALCALVFLYRNVLKKNLGEFGDITWSKKPQKLPVVFTREEVTPMLHKQYGKR